MTGGVAALFVLVLLTRAIGQSALSVASITAVGKSFGARVGMAMGVYSVLLSVLFAVAFVAIGASVRTGGWRLAWLQVAIGARVRRHAHGRPVHAGTWRAAGGSGVLC